MAKRKLSRTTKPNRKEILHLSLRLQAMRPHDNPFLPPEDLAIAVYLIFGDKKNPIDSHEHGIAMLLTKRKYQELMKTGEVFIYETISYRSWELAPWM
jgi:hypothetical protein